MSHKSYLIRATAALILIGASNATRGQETHYGDFQGANVTYRNVRETLVSEDDQVGFDAPFILDDVLAFEPSGLNAFAQDVGFQINEASLLFTVETHAERYLTDLAITTSGDTTLAGFGDDSTTTQIQSTAVLTVREVDGASIPPLQLFGSIAFAPSEGTFGLETDGFGGPSFISQWTGFASFDIAGALEVGGIEFSVGATVVDVTIDVSIAASSQAGTTAFISARDFSVVPVVIGEHPGLAYDGSGFLQWQRGFGTLYDESDLHQWEANFGSSPVATVPEPTSCLLAVCICCVCATRRFCAPNRTEHRHWAAPPTPAG
jgi:hypothetical protein